MSTVSLSDSPTQPISSARRATEFLRPSRTCTGWVCWRTAALLLFSALAARLFS
ncbi:MAG: hypothetical protein MUF66_14325 [Gammaproteobacteria bacterium]|jgi:hypothetical protein|nr:hypothetical protein [Gammaproteobacteria bacterium]